MIHSIDVEITTPLYPTEVRDRVENAIHRLFPDADTEERNGELLAETHSLERFAERLDEQNIAPTARTIFFRGQKRDTFSFALKKAAAFEGVVNFAVGNPDELGDVHVSVRVEEPNPAAFIDYIAPPEDDEDGADEPER
jgi:predicted RNA binding protein with dsRBD fold (UPF0201 family)